MVVTNESNAKHVLWLSRMRLMRNMSYGCQRMSYDCQGWDLLELLPKRGTPVCRYTAPLQ